MFIVHGLGWFLCDFYVPYVSLHIIEVDHVGHQKRKGGHLIGFEKMTTQYQAFAFMRRPNIWGKEN